MTITLYSHKGGPNGWKVVIVLEALGLKYETIFLDFNKGEHKAPEYTKYNPNGRIPCIIDHDNNDFTLWESNAIVKYLVDTYDKDYKLHFKHGTREYYEQEQWMTFQVSGQGPYFGQVVHFMRAHQIKLPTAIERYQNEVIRVISVLNDALSGKQYLVGGKLSIADLVFVPWDGFLPILLEGVGMTGEEGKAKYKNFSGWDDRVGTNPAVKKMFELRAKANAEA